MGVLRRFMVHLVKVGWLLALSGMVHQVRELELGNGRKMTFVEGEDCRGAYDSRCLLQHLYPVM